MTDTIPPIWRGLFASYSNTLAFEQNSDDAVLQTAGHRFHAGYTRVNGSDGWGADVGIMTNTFSILNPTHSTKKHTTMAAIGGFYEYNLIHRWIDPADFQFMAHLGGHMTVDVNNAYVNLSTELQLKLQFPINERYLLGAFIGLETFDVLGRGDDYESGRKRSNNPVNPVSFKLGATLGFGGVGNK